MAENKNITMKQYNGTDYDVLYPKTKVSQVDGAVASVNNVTPDNTGAVKVDTFDQSIKVGKNVDVGTDGGASAVQFHFDGNANAYTSRIVESESGALTVEAILTNTSTINIQRDNHPALCYNTAAGKNKAAVICSAGAADHDGGIILRGWNPDSSDYRDLVLTYANSMAVPVSNGGTGATNAAHANQNLFNSGEIANATGYPTVPGIWRTVGTNIFSNLKAPHGNYGVLIIFKAVYGLHIYIDESGRFYWGRSGDSFGEPATWYGQNTLTPDCYGTSLPSAGTQGRIFFKKV